MRGSTPPRPPSPLRRVPVCLSVCGCALAACPACMCDSPCPCSHSCVKDFGRDVTSVGVLLARQAELEKDVQAHAERIEALAQHVRFVVCVCVHPSSRFTHI
jgi:hypothetical protein